MSVLRKIILGASTFGAALAIGFVMQNGDAVAERFAGESGESAAGPVVLAAAFGAPPALVAPPRPSPAPALARPAPVDPPEAPRVPLRLAALEPMAGPGAEAGVAGGCAVDLAAGALSRARVSLVLEAPCRAGEEVMIHQRGVMFALRLDHAGRAEAVMPALSPEPVFLAGFADGALASAELRVPEAARYAHAVLQWDGRDGLGIHAREYGAGYGEAGHVWAASTGPAAEAGGYLVRLGDPAAARPAIAEIYAFPMAAARPGSIALGVEAEVTAANCGARIEALALQFLPGGETAARDLSLTMPDCDAAGSLLLLQSLFADLTIPAR